MKDEPEYWTWDDAIAHVMKTTGKNRRQATAALVEKCRSGELPSTGELDGERVPIPPEAWPKIN